MCAEAYLHDNKIFLNFEKFESFDSFGFSDGSYNLGANLTGFLRVNVDDLNELFDSIIKISVNADSEIDFEHNKKQFERAAKKISRISPYLTFYSHMMFRVLYCLVAGNFADIGAVIAQLPNCVELDEKYAHLAESFVNSEDDFLEAYYPKDYLNKCQSEQKKLLIKSLCNILYIKDSILSNITMKIELINDVLSFVYRDGGNLLERLYSYDKDNHFFSGFSYNIKLVQNDKSKIIAETYDIGGIDDLIRFELTKSIICNVNIKKCANCGFFFASYGRADTIYCDVVLPKQKSCSETGALNKFKEKTQSNPVFEEFNRAYKRNNAKYRAGKMDDFLAWSQEARNKRDLCLKGKLKLDDYVKWLGNRK